ncbi:MAG TPA: dTMP kinase [bacterium]|nr:dTMP kinase [bacterium]
MLMTFEGPEGSGKTTQIVRAVEYLRSCGLPVVQTREPGGTPIADQIRAVLLRADNAAITPLTELLLYFAARAQHVAEVVRPALEAGKIVVCDRFADSTWAYQGHARGMNTEMIERLNDIATGGLRPDLTLLYDLPIEEGLRRARSRAECLDDAEREDRFENEALEFHRKLREGFLLLARREPLRFRVIDAAGSVDEVWQRTKALLDAEVLGRNA